MWNNFPLIHEACRRLQKVVIENKDFEKLIKQYDRPESFFYCDPPYYETEDYYEGAGFTVKDHKRLADCLCGIQGKFLLSYNDCPEIRELYSRPGITIESTSRLSNIAQRYEAGKQYAELLISNYDTTEWLESCRQMSLFDLFDQSKELLKERKIIWKTTATAGSQLSQN
jgi:DNA adenine methylase